MDGIVADLENENRKLRAELTYAAMILWWSSNDQDAALIPQYRNAL